jgi:hypothetical protein
MSPEVKEFEPDDPMELVGVALPAGDQDQLLDDIVLEYLFMGSTPLQILMLFRSPCYGATHQIYRQKGEAYVKERIQRLAEQWSQGWIKEGERNG